MTKHFATLALLFLNYLLHAQDGYVKFTADSPFRGGKIKIFQGEIVPYFNSTKANKINVIVGNDTITELSSTSKSYSVVSPVKLNYLSQKDEFIQLRKGVGIVVNISSIDETDSAVIFSEFKTQLTKLVNEREATIIEEDCGKTFRLVISNAPTIYYSVESLKEFVEPSSIQKGTQPEETTVKEEDGWAWWYYVLIILGVLGISFGIWKFLKRKKRVESNSVIFNSSSLKDFANQWGGVKKLHQLNPTLIPANWDKLQGHEKNRVIENLKGKRIIVRSDNENSFGFQNESNFREEESVTKEWSNQQDNYTPQTNFGNNDGLSNQLRLMEENIKREIRNYGSSNNNSNELNKLNREITDLRNEKNKVENEKQNLANSINQLQRDKENAETNLQNANNEKTKVQSELNDLQERVVALDFLKGYAESVFNYLEYCQKVSADAYNFFQKVSQHNPKQAYAAGHLLMRFQTNINSLPIGNWTQIVQDIRDTGATTNRQLTRSFSQIQGNAERQKEFQRLLFSKVLVKYSSNILILAEAFKNISKFQGATDFANEAQNTFGKHITEIVSRAKATELELKHVSLFENWERYMGQVEDSGSERSLAYKDVEGLTKGSIAEIISVGVKTFDEDTKTMIIIHS